MATPAPTGSAWWHEQDGHLGTDQSQAQSLFARPSVTTGATLPWGAKANSTLGPPRAFYAGLQSIPTITVTSNQSGMANFVCKPDGGNAAVLQSPFAEIAASRDGNSQDGASRNALSRGGAHFLERLEPALPLAPEDITVIDYPKQGSLQSASTSFALDSSQPSTSGHVITTAQDDQGMAITIGNSQQVGDLNTKSTLLFHSAPLPPHQGVVTTNSSLQTANPLPQAGKSSLKANSNVLQEPADKPVQTLSGQAGSPQEGSPHKRTGLRSDTSPEAKEEHLRPVEDQQDAEPLISDDESSDLDREENAHAHENQRRIRRRKNNRESAKRVREKRDADLKNVNEKVAKLQEVQAKLLEHCSQMDNACRNLNEELQSMRTRLETSNAENIRLMTEVEHLRRNVSLGEQRTLGGKHTGPEDFHHATMDLGLVNGGMEDNVSGLIWGQPAFNPLVDQYSQDWKSW